MRRQAESTDGQKDGRARWKGPAWLWSLLQLQLLRRLIQEPERGRECKSPWRGGRLLQVPPGQPPCCLDGDHYCFLRGRKGAGLQPGQGPRERPPLIAPQELQLGLGSCPKDFTPFSTWRGVGVRLRGPHLRQTGRPKDGVESSVCPSCLPTRVQTQSQDKKILW